MKSQRHRELLRQLKEQQARVNKLNTEAASLNVKIHDLNSLISYLDTGSPDVMNELWEQAYKERAATSQRAFTDNDDAINYMTRISVTRWGTNEADLRQVIKDWVDKHELSRVVNISGEAEKFKKSVISKATSDCAMIVERLSAHPLLVEHTQAVHSAAQRHEPFFLSSPRLALGEKLMYAASIANGDVCFDSDIHPGARAELALELIEAPVYLWQSEQWNMAGNAHLPPHHVTENQLPYPAVYFTFKSRFKLERENVIGSVLKDFVSVDSALLTEKVDSKRLAIFMFGSKLRENGTEDTENICCACDVIPLDKNYPEDYTSVGLQGISAWLAVLSFLRSPHIEKDESKLSRTERRELERQGHPLKDHDRVHFITLRRHQAAKERAEREPIERDPNAPKREFRHQWMVCGHHRNQWYPSLRANKMIWISPYLKGPEDKPLITKTYKVAR